jgi:RNA polymerase sigma-B factor
MRENSAVTPEHNLPAFAAQSEDAAELLRQYLATRDLSVRNRLVLMHSRLVHYFAGRLASGGKAAYEDLVQVGYMGLIAALERYDTRFGASFVTYASPTIAGMIKRHLRDHTWAFKVPRRLRELGINLRKERAELETRLGRPPTVEELARHVRLPEERVLEAMDLERVYQPVSLDASWGEDASDNPAALESLGDEDPGLVAVEQREALLLALSRLDERERKIILGRFYGEASQAQIAQHLGISQMHVSRLERQALRRLRAMLG